MLQLTDTRKTRRVAIVAALMTFASAGIAVAQQPGTLPGIAPVQNGMQTRGNAQGLQSIVSRAMQLQQASQTRLSSAPTGAKTSYSAANQAFGEMLTSLGNAAPTNGVSAPQTGQTAPIVSSEQAASDVRALKAAARRAGSTAETDKLNKAASLYATGTKEFLTGQLREALLETGAEPVVIRGDARAADAAARQANQPPAKVTPPPATPAKPNTPQPNNPNPPQNPPLPDPNNPGNPTDPTVPQNNPNNPPNPTVPPNPNNPPVPTNPNVPPPTDPTGPQNPPVPVVPPQNPPPGSPK